MVKHYAYCYYYILGRLIQFLGMTLSTRKFIIHDVHDYFLVSCHLLIK